MNRLGHMFNILQKLPVYKSSNLISTNRLGTWYTWIPVGNYLRLHLLQLREFFPKINLMFFVFPAHF